MDLSGRDRTLHLGIGHLGFEPQLLDLLSNRVRFLVELVYVLFVSQAVAHLSATMPVRSSIVPLIADAVPTSSPV